METPLLVEEPRFLDTDVSLGARVWDQDNLRRLASLEVPESLLSRRWTLLRADINQQWARWFVEGLADPRRYADHRPSYPRIFEDVLGSVETCFGHLSKPERIKLASSAARIVLDSAKRLRVSQERRRLSTSERWQLLDLAGPSPHCWICGAEFVEKAIENFISNERHSIDLPPFVDILKPRGLFMRDFSVEVDHIVPHSHGGGDDENLALACGWCNRHKGAYTSIYDVEGRPVSPKKTSFEATSLPQPFWTVRVLATGRTCEHPEGCVRSSVNAEVTVTPLLDTGALNPMNLHVTCSEHDPLRSWRYQSHTSAKRAWRL